MAGESQPTGNAKASFSVPPPGPKPTLRGMLGMGYPPNRNANKPRRRSIFVPTRDDVRINEAPSVWWKVNDR